MLAPVTLDAIRQARSHIASYAMRSPLIRLPGWEGPGVIYLKLENLQPEYFESIGIRSVPTLRLYRGDEMIAERHGFANPTEIEAWVKEASE